MKNITFISGLYNHQRCGIKDYKKTQSIIVELSESLKLNQWYKSQLVCYADSKEMAKILTKQGCYVHKIFDNAPHDIIFDAVHKMKHWMVLNALKEFKHIIWLDWDTYNIKPLDDIFFDKCFNSNKPKFTRIDNYWAGVNCSVYYANYHSIKLMENSFTAEVEEPNDELLWKSVLPHNVRDIKDYWFDDYVINIWDAMDFNLITNNTYFLHLKDFSMLKELKNKNL
jgi:hypothetical protein